MSTVTPNAPDELRYPLGKFQRPAEPLDAAARATFIDIIAATPANLAEAVRGRTEAQLDTPYRPGGWTVRQLVHHVADSHMNAYIRVKLALTEDAPAIKAYDENEWAKLSDSSAPIDMSLTLLTALHDRWVRLMRSMQPSDFTRTLTHPDRGPITVDFLLALYAWHGPHHTAHITRKSS